MSGRVGTLLVTVQGLSGATYDAGTKVVVSGRGSSVDAFVNGDWLPLAWWEFSEGNLGGLDRREGPAMPTPPQEP